MNEPKPEFASFAKQMQAGFLDWMTYLCVYIPGALLLLNVHMYDLFFPLLHFKVYLAVVIIPSILTVVWWIQMRSTPGKLLRNLQILRLDGKPMTNTDVTIRFICMGFSTLMFGMGFLPAFSNKHQSLHDLLAGTAVFHVKPKPKPKQGKALRKDTRSPPDTSESHRLPWRLNS